VLNAVGGNKTHAARILGIDRRSLYRRLEEPRHEQKAGSATPGESHPRMPAASVPPPASNGHASSGAGSGGPSHPEGAEPG
jgi:hypothetical protein